MSGGIVRMFPRAPAAPRDVRQVRHGIAYLAVRSGAPVLPVACHGTMVRPPLSPYPPAPQRAAARTREGRAFFRPHHPPVLVALGDPLRLPAGPTVRRTVAAAEIHRALAAHVAAARPAPTEPERDQP